MKVIFSLLWVAITGFVAVMKDEVKLKLIADKQLVHYPSASSIQFYKDRLYIMGDDAAQLLILDKQYTIVDSVQLFESAQVRISKKIKADLESSAVIEYENKKQLLLCGSGATKNRETAMLIDLNDLKVKRFNIHSFLKQIKKQVKEVNIEGCAIYKDKIILSNRANRSNKQNQLIITDKSFFVGGNTQYSILPVVINTDAVIGISSLHYLADEDRLLFTATTEDTRSSYEDGAIGDSYIGIIESFSKKITSKMITPDELINLSTQLPVFKQKKIEGLAVEEADTEKMTLHLVSDNDNGESGMYKVKFKIK